ncbi:hypothetical protein [Marinomonas gallaica]|uniref:hypothetical protein n=1 Tax=Marinomonas gallaica TaxID=1806667 RepID=UPI00082F78C3|nr:hypothetical protein [Marinomonas gallaica]
MPQFSVVSYGYSASRWVAFALASHPDVFVAHGTYALNSIMDGNPEAERDKGASGDRLDPLTRGRTDLQLKDYSLGELYELCQTQYPGRASYGNVHTFVPRELFYKADFEHVKPSVFHLVREPFAFVTSHTSGVLQAEEVPELCEHYQRFFNLFRERFPHIQECQWFDPASIQQKAFLVSCYTLFNLAQDIRRYGAKMTTVRMEELTIDIDCLKSACEQITGLEYDKATLQVLFNTGALNLHQKKQSDKPIGYDTWMPWQQEAFRYVLSEELYEYLNELGYPLPTLSFRYKQFD